jgi:hypothetical protein
MEPGTCQYLDNHVGLWLDVSMTNTNAPSRRTHWTITDGTDTVVVYSAYKIDEVLQGMSENVRVTKWTPPRRTR